MHGELDVRAPYRQFEIAVAELERHGKVSQTVPELRQPWAHRYKRELAVSAPSLRRPGFRG